MPTAASLLAARRAPSRGQQLAVEAFIAVGIAVTLLVVLTVAPSRFGASTELTALGAVLAGGLFVNPRVDLSLIAIALYLGCLDGPFKLTTGDNSTTLVRDVLIFAVLGGVLGRAAIAGRRLPSVPYAGLALAVIGAVVVQAANPDTPGLTGVFAGMRQHLEFVPLLFLGALVADNRRVLPALAVVLIAITFANTVAAVVQYNLTPQQFANWGPGYSAKILGTGDFQGGARTFNNGKRTKVRPFGLGSDSGASGIYGWLAMPFALMLLLGARSRRDIGLGAGAFVVCGVGLLASQSRGVVLAALAAVVGFFVLRTQSRNAASTALASGAAGLLIYAFVTVFAAHQDSGSLDRFKSITPGNAAGTIQRDRGSSISLIPQYAVDYPLGVGLARAGPASGTAGSPSHLNAENEPNLLIGEIGTIGFLLFAALWLVVVRDACLLARRVQDETRRTLWCAVAAALLGASVVWLQAPVTTGPPVGALFWLFAGLVGYEIRKLRREAEEARPA